jgi:nitrogen PTS system EIIA component
MSIQHCFVSGTVVSNLAATDKFDAIREIIRRAPVFEEIEGRQAFEDAVLERERLQSTGLGHGVAVAHGRAAGIARVLIAMGMHRDGVPYESPDGAPVHLLFVIASPLHVSIDYLQALSTLVRCLRSASLREQLLGADSERECERRIREAFAGELEHCQTAPVGRDADGVTG